FTNGPSTPPAPSQRPAQSSRYRNTQDENDLLGDSPAGGRNLPWVTGYQTHPSRTKPLVEITLTSCADSGGLMRPQFMDSKQTAEYLNMSVTWVYRDAPRLGLTAYKFGAGRNAKLQFKVADVDAWARQQRLG
ncbi:helix-turn-helix domain-containing protein, partial [Streptomyces sp. NPDC001661]